MLTTQMPVFFIYLRCGLSTCSFVVCRILGLISFLYLHAYLSKCASCLKRNFTYFYTFLEKVGCVDLDTVVEITNYQEDNQRS